MLCIDYVEILQKSFRYKILCLISYSAVRSATLGVLNFYLPYGEITKKVFKENNSSAKSQHSFCKDIMLRVKVMAK